MNPEMFVSLYFKILENKNISPCFLIGCNTFHFTSTLFFHPQMSSTRLSLTSQRCRCRVGLLCHWAACDRGTRLRRDAVCLCGCAVWQLRSSSDQQESLPGQSQCLSPVSCSWGVLVYFFGQVWLHFTLRCVSPLISTQPLHSHCHPPILPPPHTHTPTQPVLVLPSERPDLQNPWPSSAGECQSALHPINNDSPAQWWMELPNWMALWKHWDAFSEAIKLMSPEWDDQSTRLIRWMATTMALTPPKWGRAFIIITLFYHGSLTASL